MERFTATLHRSCNALTIIVLLLGGLSPARNMSSPRFESPIAHAQGGATIIPLSRRGCEATSWGWGSG
jgi:hypothetical protein